MDDIKTVAIIGAGFLGSQIAAWSALHDYEVHIFDISSEALEKTKEIAHQTIELYCAQEEGRKPEECIERIFYHDKLADTVSGADLIIEAVPEKLELKKEIFAQIDKNAPAHAIIATNSSSIPVSKIEDSVQRKDKVLNIHFYAPSQIPMVDIMRGSKTSDETFAMGKAWIESINCVPLVVLKETLGFVFNRVWRAVKREAIHMWAGGYADFRDIDRAWMVFTGMGLGPFALMDAVGLDVVYDVEMTYFNESRDPKDEPPKAFKEMVDRGELGMKTIRGFYDWNDPECVKPDFIKIKRKK